MGENELVQSYSTELRRGSLTMVVLACLRGPHYGYALLQALQEKGVAIEANTLYPLLRRLESQGLLASDWDVSESRPRKYYTLSDMGQRVLARLWEEWKAMRLSLEAICGEEESDGKLTGTVRI